jgi:glyoxylase I family protein
MMSCHIGIDSQYAELRRVAPLMLGEWDQIKVPPRHAHWRHEEARLDRD